jgi:hypothetical protein
VLICGRVAGANQRRAERNVTLLIACVLIYGFHLPEWMYAVAIAVYLLSSKTMRALLMQLHPTSRALSAKLAVKEMKEAGELPADYDGDAPPSAVWVGEYRRRKN